MCVALFKKSSRTKCTCVRVYRLRKVLKSDRIYLQYLCGHKGEMNVLEERLLGMYAYLVCTLAGYACWARTLAGNVRLLGTYACWVCTYVRLLGTYASKSGQNYELKPQLAVHSEASLLRFPKITSVCKWLACPTLDTRGGRTLPK
jgi:hypothetical protein